MDGKVITNGEKAPTAPNSALIFCPNNDVDGLVQALRIFKENGVELQHIESRKVKAGEKAGQMEVYAEVGRSSAKLSKVAEALKTVATSVTVKENKMKMQKSLSLDKPSPTNSLQVQNKTNSLPSGQPWYPKHISELDKSARRVYMYGEDLEADHPGFNDKEYRKRRMMFAEIAYDYKYGQPIPRVEYTEEETKTWGTIFRKLTKLYKKHACSQYLDNFPLLENNCGYRENNIPQLDDISRYMRERTGFTLRPVAGYLSSRDFLAGLAFRVFHCTQYIRHGADPFYSPEPDCCHELLGHMPLFLDASFAEFSQDIGLASLGASDEDVLKFASLYFFTVEFGMCRQNGQLKVYGAGLLSSADELQHSVSDKAVIKPFDVRDICSATCQITTYQDQYYYTDKFDDAKDTLRQFAHSMNRPFELRYDAYTQTVETLDKTASIAKAMDELKYDVTILASALNKLVKASA